MNTAYMGFKIAASRGGFATPITPYKATGSFKPKPKGGDVPLDPNQPQPQPQPLNPTSLINRTPEEGEDATANLQGQLQQTTEQQEVMHQESEAQAAELQKQIEQHKKEVEKHKADSEAAKQEAQQAKHDAELAKAQADLAKQEIESKKIILAEREKSIKPQTSNHLLDSRVKDIHKRIASLSKSSTTLTSKVIQGSPASPAVNRLKFVKDPLPLAKLAAAGLGGEDLPVVNTKTHDSSPGTARGGISYKTVETGCRGLSKCAMNMLMMKSAEAKLPDYYDPYGKAIAESDGWREGAGKDQSIPFHMLQATTDITPRSDNPNVDRAMQTTRRHIAKLNPMQNSLFHLINGFTGFARPDMSRYQTGANPFANNLSSVNYLNQYANNPYAYDQWQGAMGMQQ